MTCLLPEARISAGDARNFLEAEGAFPSYFGSCLYDLFVALHWQGMLPDTRIDIISSVSALATIYTCIIALLILSLALHSIMPRS
jgi:hypothetical protein